MSTPILGIEIEPTSVSGSDPLGSGGGSTGRVSCTGTGGDVAGVVGGGVDVVDEVDGIVVVDELLVVGAAVVVADATVVEVGGIAVVTAAAATGVSPSSSPLVNATTPMPARTMATTAAPRPARRRPSRRGGVGAGSTAVSLADWSPGRSLRRAIIRPSRMQAGIPMPR